jgi:hypothetical protein
MARLATFVTITFLFKGLSVLLLHQGVDVFHGNGRSRGDVSKRLGRGLYIGCMGSGRPTLVIQLSSVFIDSLFTHMTIR